MPAASSGRLRLEGETTKADVVLGLDMNLAAEAKALGLFAKHGTSPPSRAADRLVGRPLHPFDWGYLAFVYDSDKLKAPPASLKDLVENPNGPTVVLQDPRPARPDSASCSGCGRSTATGRRGVARS